MSDALKFKQHSYSFKHKLQLAALNMEIEGIWSIFNEDVLLVNDFKKLINRQVNEKTEAMLFMAIIFCV